MQVISGHYEYNKGLTKSADPVVAALTRLIWDAEREISRLKRKRKAHLTRLRLAKQRETPEFKARHLAGLRRGAILKELGE